MKIWEIILFFLVLSLIPVTASAGKVTLTGDARARYKVKDNYLFGNINATTLEAWDSRVRINFNAQSDGGAYAKARLRLERDTWGSSELTIEPWIDIAYIGVPIGPATVEAGLTKSNITKFFQWDQSVDQLSAEWVMFNASWTASYRVISEGTQSSIDIDRINDNDNVAYGLVVKKSYADTFSSQLNLFYQNDQRDNMVTGQYIPDATGFFGSFFLKGSYTDLSWESELAFKSGDTRQSRDENGLVTNQTNVNQGDGWGWYFKGEYKRGDFVPVLNIGTVWNGFQADNDFGWIMIGNGNNEPITVIPQLGENGDWLWIAPSILYKMNENVSISGNVVWVTVEAVENAGDDTLHYKNLYELSADLTYTISDGATFTWKLGLLKPEIEGHYKGNEASEEVAFGTYARLQIAF